MFMDNTIKAAIEWIALILIFILGLFLFEAHCSPRPTVKQTATRQPTPVGAFTARALDEYCRRRQKDNKTFCVGYFLGSIDMLRGSIEGTPNTGFYRLRVGQVTDADAVHVLSTYANYARVNRLEDSDATAVLIRLLLDMKLAEAEPIAMEGDQQ
jgi:hypothetical protein